MTPFTLKKYNMNFSFVLKYHTKIQYRETLDSSLELSTSSTDRPKYELTMTNSVGFLIHKYLSKNPGNVMSVP